MNGVFVTGTDTEVGKTVIGAATVAHLTASGTSIAVRKPVESGCAETADGLHPADGAALHRAAGAREPLVTVTPWRLRHAISPERAGRLEELSLDRSDLVAAVAAGAAADCRWIEGAGGLLSPLTGDALNADLAVALGLPVIVVAADRLGCINHTLLTVEAAASRGLTVAAVVVNAVDPGDGGPTANREDLAARLACPVIGWAHGGDAAAELARYL